MCCSYRGNGHFVAFIKVDNVIFAYDGMIEDGMLRPTQANAFRNVHGTMRAKMVWYRQNLYILRRITTLTDDEDNFINSTS